jgi:hypothetical protein
MQRTLLRRGAGEDYSPAGPNTRNDASYFGWA